MQFCLQRGIKAYPEFNQNKFRVVIEVNGDQIKGNWHIRTQKRINDKMKLAYEYAHKSFSKGVTEVKETEVFIKKVKRAKYSRGSIKGAYLELGYPEEEYKELMGLE